MNAARLMPLMALGIRGRRIAAEAVRYERFMVAAQALGLTVEEAKTIVEEEATQPGGYGDVMDRAERRLYEGPKP